MEAPLQLLHLNLWVLPPPSSTLRMRSSIHGIYHPGGVFRPSAINIGQFGKLTDRTERTQPLSLSKGPFPNRIFIPSLTHPALIYCSSFRVSLLLLVLISVFFREIPWQMLMLSCPTVAHASGSESSVFFVANASACSYFRVSASVFSVKFRVRPWQILLLGFLPFLISVAMLILNSFAHVSGSERHLFI